MPIRLNITIDKDVHERLKRELPAKGISRFINEAGTVSYSNFHRRLYGGSPVPGADPFRAAFEWPLDSGVNLLLVLAAGRSAGNERQL